MWLYLSLAAFVGFLISVGALARRGFDREGKLQKRGFWLILAIFGTLGTWMLALSRVPPPYPLENTRFYRIPVGKSGDKTAP